jgi:CRISPR-associated protein Csh2
MTQINNRSEVIFIYDVKDNNPNGDPLNENMPRIDQETGINYVTDVRLKRTIRDFIAIEYGQQAPNLIFMLAQRKDDETLQTMKERIGEFKNIDDIIKQCIDIRLFGGTLAFAEAKNKKKGNKNKEENEEMQDEDAKSIAITGPVQFRIGRSMHKVFHKEDQISRMIPNDENKKQGTFGFDHRLFYSLIKFYGVINENAAIRTNLSNEDIEVLLRAMWDGTKALNTRTKIGHMPRLLVKVDYAKSFFIGDLDSKIKMEKVEKTMDDLSIRSCEDYVLDISKLITELNNNAGRIDKITIIKHPDIKIKEEDITAIKGNNKINFKEILNWE